MSPETSALPAPIPRVAAPVRILAGARGCFAELGIEKATIVDIAEAAGYSRPVIYKHFADKADIVDSVCLEEMKSLQIELNRKVDRGLPFDCQLVEAILQGVLLAHGNPYIQRFMQDRDTWVRSQSAGGKVHVWVRNRWTNFLQRGRAIGTLADDLDVEQTVTWISMVQSLLLLRYASEDMDDTAMRDFIRRFVVKPLLR
jgi:AcrR family transcriptional regulator